MKIINALILCALAHVVSGQGNTVNKNQNDPHFPAKGRFNAGILTTYSGLTPPPVLIGNVTYGISNRFSVGIVGGTTGNLAVYGIKLNAVILQKENFRLAYRMISVYYPERNGTFLFDRTNQHVMPWMLSMGVIDAEWRTDKGIRWSVGMGLLETHCVDGMKKWLGNLLRHSSGTDASEADGDLPFEVFTTLQGSVSIPVSKRLTLRPEVYTVFKGTRLINRGEFMVGFPIIATVSLAYSF